MTIKGTNFNTLLSLQIETDDKNKQAKKSKGIEKINNMTSKSDLINRHNALQSKTSEYPFFSSAHTTFIKTDHRLTIVV